MWAGGSLRDLREANLTRLLHALITHRELTRGELGAITGLVPSALTKLINELERRDLVREVSEIRSGDRGRPVRPLTLASQNWAIAGVQLNKHSIYVTGAALDGARICHVQRVISGDAAWSEYRDGLDDALAELMRNLAADSRALVAVELAVPGAANRHTGEVVRSRLNDWSRFDLTTVVQNQLARHIGEAEQRPVVALDRETNYSLLARVIERRRTMSSELNLFNGDARESIVYIGGRFAVSGGSFVEGIEHGTDGLAGEYGHLIVDPEGESCWCGRRGCLETRVGLIAMHRKIFSSDHAVERLDQVGNQLAAEILEELDNKTQRAVEVVTAAGQWLGVAIDSIAAVSNPGVVLVDGYLASLGPVLRNACTQHLEALGNLPSIAALSLEFCDGSDDIVNRGLLASAQLGIQPLLADASA